MVEPPRPTDTVAAAAASALLAADITDRPQLADVSVAVPSPIQPVLLPCLDDLSTGATGKPATQTTTTNRNAAVVDDAMSTMIPAKMPVTSSDAVTATVINKSSAAAANDADEKCDAEPENSRKSCDISPDTGDEISLITNDTTTPTTTTTTPDGATTSTTTEDVESSQTTDISETSAAAAAAAAKSALAFTIDFGDGTDQRQVNSKKYNDIFERFQRRHRRGASMSKLEDAAPTTTAQQTAMTMSQPQSAGRSRAPLRKTASTVSASESPTTTTTMTTGKVQLRDKSRRDVSNAENRHSWSPRNSSVQPTPVSGRQMQTQHRNENAHAIAQSSPARQQRKFSADQSKSNNSATASTFQPKSATLQMAFESIKCNFELSQHKRNHPAGSVTSTEMVHRDDADHHIPCPAPPLEYQTKATSVSSVSEAGTYTLDGDNYTEEQKEQMSIDKLAKLSLKTTDTATTIAPSMSANQIHTIASAAQTETTSAEIKVKTKTKTTSYLERIKSKVRNISDRTFHKQQQHGGHNNRISPEVELPPNMSQYAVKQPQPPTTLDLGNFTSITSAGAFSKLSGSGGGMARSMGGRKHSLTKSQIDNSEYIQHCDHELTMNSFTDYEKARHHDYQLNMFAGDASKTASTAAAEPASPGTGASSSGAVSSSESSFGIERAETKNDWIQEWAKNARRNTKKTISTAMVEPSPVGLAIATNGGTSTNVTNNSSSDYSDINQNATQTQTAALAAAAARHQQRNMLVYHGQEANLYASDLHRFDERNHRQSESPAPRRRHQQQQQQLHQQMYTDAAPTASASHSEFGDEDDDDDDDDDHDDHDENEAHECHPYDGRRSPRELRPGSRNEQLRREFYDYNPRASRPPASPSKIPSPMHSLARPRSSSMNRSLHGSISDLDSVSHNDDTGMYLNKTAAAINQLQHIHRQNSPQSPRSPQHTQHGKIASNFMTSPSVRRHYKHSPFAQLTAEQQAAVLAARPPHAVPSPTHHQHHHGSNASLHLHQQQQQSNHRRNHSLDNADAQLPPGPRSHSLYRTANSEAMSHSHNSDTLRDALRGTYHNQQQTHAKNHSRHHSYDNSGTASPSQQQQQQHHQHRSPAHRTRLSSIDQTFAQHILNPTTTSATATSSATNKTRSKSANVTPATIKRSSSFSTKPFLRPQSSGTTSGRPTNSQTVVMTPKMLQRSAFNGSHNGFGGALQKSASSNNFKSTTNTTHYGGAAAAAFGHNDIYLNANDDLYAKNFSSDSADDLSDAQHSATPPNAALMSVSSSGAELLSNTRYNRAFLARLEQNKPRTVGGYPANSVSTASACSANAASSSSSKQQGVIACPNTPELPRRDLRARQSLRDRASMPRDASINRMKQDLAAGTGTSLAAAKRTLMETPAVVARGSAQSVATSTTTAAAAVRVQPKYLDISKYKPQQGNTFLRRDESKSTLNPQLKDIRRSTTSTFGGGVGGSGGRSADPTRSSVRSVKSAASSAGSGGGIASSRPTMSASKDEATHAADLAMWRRRASYDPMKAAAEGKRKLEAKKSTQAGKFNESSPSVVLRSQSYHSGVGQSAMTDNSGHFDGASSASNSKRWTLISTESSEDDDQHHHHHQHPQY